jgi:hypothetical protein
MSTFWKHLTEVAKGQLFIGGHLSTAVVADLAKRASAPCKGKRHSSSGHSPWPRLATPH